MPTSAHAERFDFKPAIRLGMSRAALVNAVQAGDEAAARKILSAGIDLDFPGNAVPLAIQACERDHPGFLRALIEHGAVPQENRAQWLHDAVWKCHASDSPACLMALLTEPSLPRLFVPEGLRNLFAELRKSPRCVAALESALLREGLSEPAPRAAPALRI